MEEATAMQNCSSFKATELLQWNEKVLSHNVSYTYAYRALKCSNIRMLCIYMLCNDVHMMQHCDLKTLNLHLFFYLSFGFF